MTDIRCTCDDLRPAELCEVHMIYRQKELPRHEPAPYPQPEFDPQLELEEYTPKEKLQAEVFRTAWETANAQGLKGQRTLEALAEVAMLEDRAWALLVAAETIKKTGGAVEVAGVRITRLEPQADSKKGGE